MKGGFKETLLKCDMCQKPYCDLSFVLCTNKALEFYIFR